MSVILSLSGTVLKSPTQPDLTEWAVCGNRLGVMACVWTFLLALFCGLRYRGFVLERQMYVHLIRYTSFLPTTFAVASSILKICTRNGLRQAR
jgi:hypothetical protein